MAPERPVNQVSGNFSFSVPRFFGLRNSGRSPMIPASSADHKGLHNLCIIIWKIATGVINGELNGRRSA